MTNEWMNVAAYFDRIGYTGPTELTRETLRRLHVCHLETVPFENLDISRGRPIVMDSGAFVRKIVEERRGGFCYELNGAFAALLSAIGFRVMLLSARVSRQDGSESPEFDHLTLRVDLSEPWLADVGFGDCFREPLRLWHAEGDFRIVDEGSSLLLQRQQAAEGWKNEYRFTLQPRNLTDFEGMCKYHQTSPESHFKQHRICSRATPTGRITLSDLKLIITENGDRQEKALSSEHEWHAALAQYFGVVL